jgi:deazaflavin-dependent oxidoreductase (nitroreductase family)
VDKRRASTFLSAKVFNRLVLAAARAGLPTPSVVILETTGRRSGQPRRVPVTRLLDGETLWIVTEHGRKAAYVRNIETSPHVRVRVGRRWRSGRAEILGPAGKVPAMVRLMGTDHLKIRVDLDPAGRPASASAAPPPAGPAPS